MGRLQTWGAAARRSPVFWAVSTVVVLALVAGGVVLATRSTPPPAPSPATSTRAVSLGDSVPYGHGLHNPYLTPQVGLPADAVSQGPSTSAYPTLVAGDLGLTMTVRPTNCRLTGDQLSISGAVADGADNTARDGQCPVPPQQARNLSDEVAAADLARHPARLVLLQDGADDIDFARCLEYELAQALGTNLGIGTRCVADGAVTPTLTSVLAHVRTSLAQAIETMAPHAGTIAVLDYYQPIPRPSPDRRRHVRVQPAHEPRLYRAQGQRGHHLCRGAGRAGGAEQGHRRRRGRRPRPTTSPTSPWSTSRPRWTGTGSARLTRGSSRASRCPTPPWRRMPPTSSRPRPAPAPMPSIRRLPARRSWRGPLGPRRACRTTCGGAVHPTAAGQRAIAAVAAQQLRSGTSF